MRFAVSPLAAAIILGFSFAATAAVQTSPARSVNPLAPVAAKGTASTPDAADSTARLIAQQKCLGQCGILQRPKRRT